MVAVSHCFIVFAVDNNESICNTRIFDTTEAQSFITRVLLVLFNGGAAVSIFFVLSGYVLGLSLDRKSNTIFVLISFYIKRIFRIYPAYIVSLTLIIASIWLFHTYIKFPNTSLWFNWWYTTDITIRNAAKNYVLMETNLNPVAWTLSVELLVSFVFPFAYFASRNVGVKLNLIFLSILMALGYKYSSISYLMFGFVFYIGLMLPILIEKLELYATKGTYNKIFVISIVCLLFARLAFEGISIFYVILVEGVASAFIVAILADLKTTVFLSKYLEYEIVKKLGQFSFSFYIYHFIILYWLSYGMLLIVSSDFTASYPILLSTILAIVSVPISYYVAILSYYGVERPMIKCGAVTSEKLSILVNNSSVRITKVVSRYRKRIVDLQLTKSFKRVK
tara:strand:- start:82597 stop:83775 length:1179 start_codon:yes stop_codon:yes gene_type:complete